MTQVKFGAGGLHKPMLEFPAIGLNEGRLMGIHFFEVARTQVLYHEPDHVTTVSQEMSHLANVCAVKVKITNIRRHGNAFPIFNDEQVFIE